MESWEIGKDVFEIAGTVGTALAIGFRLVIKARIREEKVDTKLASIMADIALLKEEKVDRAMQEAENRRLHEELKEVRMDMKDGSQMMSASIKEMAESLNKLDGTVQTFLRVFTKNQF